MFVNVAPAVPDLYSKYLGFALPICSTSTLVVDRFVPLVAFAFLTWFHLNEALTPKTAVTLVLAAAIVLIQVLWK